MKEQIIRVREFNAKVERERTVPINARLMPIMEQLLDEADKGPMARIFPYIRMKKAFAPARTKAGLDGLRWHDLKTMLILLRLN